MICNDPITCARYYDYKTSRFCTLFNKDPSIFEQVCDFFFVVEFQNHGSEHDHGLLWIKDTPIYGINNEKIKFFVDKYILCDVSYYKLHYEMHNNINTLKHVRKKSCCL